MRARLKAPGLEADGLEVKSGAKSYNAGGKSGLRSAEIRAGDIVRNAVGLEVEVIKDVVGIHAELDFCALSKHGHVGKTESLGQG